MSRVELRVATRTSPLAVAQARQVATALEAAHPGLTTRLVGVDTVGDTDRVSPVAALTEVGAFVRAVQEALLEGRADLAVHSCKDLPVRNPEGLVLAAFPERADPADVLIGSTLEHLPEHARVGTGSPRRAAQLLSLRPDLQVEEVRGNVETRIRLATHGPFDGVVLAAAGLVRLGREQDIGHSFSTTEMVPAPGQGTLAVEVREDDPARGLVEALDHDPTRLAAETERLLLEITGAGCRSAMGALATVGSAGVIDIVAFTSDGHGPRRTVATGSDPRSAAEAAARGLGL